VKTADGQPLGALYPGCIATCDVCSPVLCPLVCLAPRPLDPINGQTQIWNGTYYQQATCGAGISCVSPQCVPAGTRLLATMCASPRLNPDGGNICQPSDTPRCVDVPFVFPATTAIVVGNIDPVL
jgi:hypothetical protein